MCRKHFHTRGIWEVTCTRTCRCRVSTRMTRAHPHTHILCSFSVRLAGIFCPRHFTHLQYPEIMSTREKALGGFETLHFCLKILTCLCTFFGMFQDGSVYCTSNSPCGAGGGGGGSGGDGRAGAGGEERRRRRRPKFVATRLRQPPAPSAAAGAAPAQAPPREGGGDNKRLKLALRAKPRLDSDEMSATFRRDGEQDTSSKPKGGAR